MNEKLYKGVLSIIKGESIGCVNVSDKKEFDEIAEKTIGYGCFGDVVNNALIELIVTRVKKWRSASLIDEDFDCFDTWCEDKDYRIAFRFADILFPMILCYGIRIEKESTKVTDSVYRFAKLDDLDKENICDMFNGMAKDIVSKRLEDVFDAEKVVAMISDNSLIVPF